MSLGDLAGSDIYMPKYRPGVGGKSPEKKAKIYDMLRCLVTLYHTYPQRAFSWIPIARNPYNIYIRFVLTSFAGAKDQ